MRTQLLCGLAAVVFCALLARDVGAAQPPEDVLTNERLVGMLKAGIPLSVLQALIERKIAENKCQLTANDLVPFKLAAVEGKMDDKDAEKLLHLVLRAAEAEKKRLSSLVESFMNVCINVENETDQEYVSKMNELLREGKAVVPELMKHIEEERPKKRAGVLDALGRIGDANPQVVRSVRLMLDDREKGVRAKAAKALAALSGTTLLEDLSSLLERRKTQYPDALAMTLAYIGDPRAIPVLTLALKTSPDVDGALAAAWALGELRAREKDAVEVLLERVLDERDSRIRCAAAASLGLAGETRAVPYIIKACQRYERTDPKSTADLLGTLKAFRTRKSIEFLLDYVSSDVPELRSVANETLKHLSGEANLSGDEQWRSWYSRVKGRTEWFKPDAP